VPVSPGADIDYSPLLDVARELGAPIARADLLPLIARTACRLLDAERAGVWLVAPGGRELVLAVSEDSPGFRLPMGRGLAGMTAAEARTIEVDDCQSDPRFDRSVDRLTGQVTRNCISLPLLGADGERVGVLQVLNRQVTGSARHRQVAEALAAQAAVALLRLRAVELTLAARRVEHELELARQVQRATLPAAWPVVPGYSVHAEYHPAEATGGDAYDLAQLPSTGPAQVLLMLADASGHGLAPALAAVQMHAMLRLALRMGAGLGVAMSQVNDQLAEWLPAGRFVSAWAGLLDPARHTLQHLSAGQGPLLHLRADGRLDRHRAQLPPLGALAGWAGVQPRVLALAPGEVFLALSDGLFEQPDAQGQALGLAAVESCLAGCAAGSAADIAQALLALCRAHAGEQPQADDLTLVVLKRDSVSCHQTAT
jgi:phosphoserine phosphatase RsbU/P